MSRITVFKDGESQKITAIDLPEWNTEGWQTEDLIIPEQTTAKLLAPDPIFLHKDRNSVSVARVDLAGWLADGWVAESSIDFSSSTNHGSLSDPVNMEKNGTFALVSLIDVEMWISDGWNIPADPSLVITEGSNLIDPSDESPKVTSKSESTKKKPIELL